MNEAVLKFGGNSVSTARNILNVTDTIVDYYLANIETAVSVVVSALGVQPGGDKKDKITDGLLTTANYAYSGNLSAALAGIEWVKNRHYSVIDDLTIHGSRAERRLVAGTLSTLEEITRDAARDRDSGAKISEPQLKDAIAGLGELMSTPIVAEAVQRRLEQRFAHLEEELRSGGLDERQKKIYEHLKSCNGQYTAVLDPRENGFITNSQFTNARLLDESLNTGIARCHLSSRAKNRNRILFYPGFIATDGYGNTTTLGRDGSNVTAVALGAAIRAREIVIYTDTDGELIVDPRVIGQAQTARYLSYKEVSILSAWGGMQVLKGDSLEILYARRRSIPIRVKNSFNPQDPGTLITHQSNESHSMMKGIAIMHDVMYMEILLGMPQDFDNIESAINRYEGTRVIISSRENRSGQLVGRFVISTDSKKTRQDSDYYRAKFDRWVGQEAFKHADPKKRKIPEHFKLNNGSLITICGEGLGNSYSDRSKIEEILAGLPVAPNLREGLYHLHTMGDKDSIQVVVRREDANAVAKAIYTQLKKINIVLYGPGNVGLEFLKKLVAQYDTFGLNVVGIADRSGIYAKPGGFSATELERIIEAKSGGIKAANISVSEGGVHLIDIKNRDIKKVYEMGKGDFVLVDASDDPHMLNTILNAIESGSRAISVNKLPYAVQPLKYNSRGDRHNLERFADEKVRKLFKAMLQQRAFNRGTVGADLGVPGALLDILSKNPRYVTVAGCMSGTLGYTCTALDNGMPLSGAVQNAVAQGITEPRPFTDYSGLDVLNKTTILWRTIATKYGLSFFDCDIRYERFTDQAIKKYEKKTGKKFDAEGLENLSGAEFVERMKLLDDAFDELKAEAGNDKVFRYVGEIGIWAFFEVYVQKCPKSPRIKKLNNNFFCIKELISSFYLSIRLFNRFLPI